MNLTYRQFRSLTDSMYLDAIDHARNNAKLPAILAKPMDGPGPRTQEWFNDNIADLAEDLLMEARERAYLDGWSV